MSARAEARGHALGHREGHAQGHREGHAQGHREGHAQGHREGHAQGHQEGHAQARMEAVVAVLRARGIEVTTDLAGDLAKEPALAHGLSDDALMAAAVACTSESDFRRRVREQRALHAERPPSPNSDLEP